MAPSALHEDLRSAGYPSFVHVGRSFDTSIGQPTGAAKGWPTHLDSPLAWNGAQFHTESEYTYNLTDEDIAEIGQALEIFKGIVGYIASYIRH